MADYQTVTVWKWMVFMTEFPEIFSRPDAAERDLCDIPAPGLTSQTASKREIRPVLQQHLLLCQVSVAFPHITTKTVLLSDYHDNWT